MKHSSIILTSFFFALAAVFVPVQRAYPAGENKIDSINISGSEEEDSIVVVIESERPIRYAAKESEDPREIQIKMEEPVLFEEQAFQKVGKSGLEGIRFNYGKRPEDAKAPLKLLESVNLVLSQKCRSTVTQHDWILSVYVQAISTKTAKAPLPSLVPEARPDEFMMPALSMSDYGRTTLSEQPTMDEFVQVGLANYELLDVARKELALAKRKNFESWRNLFPTVSGKATSTKGQTLTNVNDPDSTAADFNRREFGLEFGQPIFQSGRLYYARKQTAVQIKIAELEVEKMSQDVRLEIIRAAYGYLQAKRSLSLRRDLANEAEKIMKQAQRKKEVGIASESEYLGTLAGGNQIRYKTISQEKDAEIAKSKLLAVINLEFIPEETKVAIQAIPPQLPERDLQLNNLMAMAMANRTDLRIAELKVQQKIYARKVSRAEYLFKIDASGFVGRSGAAFQSENLTLKDSYNMGIKGTLYFGGSSVNPLASSEKSAPDLGSTSRTRTDAASVSIGVLDSLGAGSNVMQAEIDEVRAREELKKARRDASIDIKEAFFNYQKAVIQIDSARKEQDYRQKEFDIASAKERLNQIETPQFLQALGSFSEAKIGLNEALVFYKISKYALEKAVGMTLFTSH